MIKDLLCVLRTCGSVVICIRMSSARFAIRNLLYSAVEFIWDLCVLEESTTKFKR